MAPQELIAHEVCSIGIRADQNAREANPDNTSRVLKHYAQQKNDLLRKDNLRQKCILGEVYRKHFPNVPPALPAHQPPNDIPLEADPKPVPVHWVFSRPTEGRDFERHATQRGCKFHSPELTVWSELSHVPSAQQPALAGRYLLF